MPGFTFDTNCLIAIDEGRPEAAAIQAIVAAHRAGQCRAAFVAVSASENPRAGIPQITNFAEFQARLAQLGLSDLEILKPLLYWGISFWDWATWSSPEDAALARQLHGILFPKDAFDLDDFLRERGSDPKAPLKWRNQKCDVLAMWSHIKHERNVFVTTDGNFHTHKIELIALGAGAIEGPAEAAALLKTGGTAMTHLHQQTSTIRALFDDQVTFWGMPSGYRVPPHLIAILRTALEKHREVKVTFEGVDSISAAVMMPPPPVFTRLCDAAVRLRLRLMRR